MTQTIKMRVRQDMKHLANFQGEVDKRKLIALVTLECEISSVNSFFYGSKTAPTKDERSRRQLSKLTRRIVIFFFQIQTNVCS